MNGSPPPEHGDITKLLHLAGDGDAAALRRVLELLHERLRGIAHRQLAGEDAGHTLETDGLVHEAYLAAQARTAN